jgi:hypothetical protein
VDTEVAIIDTGSDNDENLNEGTGSNEGDEDIEEIEHLFDLAEKDVDEFCDNFVGEEENWNSVLTFARE